jgi:hypothetical protein
MLFIMKQSPYATQELAKLKEDPVEAEVAAGLAALPRPTK